MKNKILIISVSMLVLSLAPRVHAQESCDITIKSPSAGSALGTSFVVSGVIQEHSETCATWIIQEGSVGTVSVYGANNILITGPITLTGPKSSGYPDFKYTYPITFSQTITLEKPTMASTVILSDYGEDDPFEKEEISTKTVSLTSNQKDDSDVVPSRSFVGFKTLLKSGMQIQDVAEMQKVLKKKGFFTDTISGYLGSQTVIAVKNYQSWRGLTADGVVGQKTRAWLNEDI